VTPQALAAAQIPGIRFARVFFSVTFARFRDTVTTVRVYYNVVNPKIAYFFG